jgi:hypothetical protein
MADRAASISINKVTIIALKVEKYSISAHLLAQAEAEADIYEEPCTALLTDRTIEIVIITCIALHAAEQRRVESKCAIGSIIVGTICTASYDAPAGFTDRFSGKIGLHADALAGCKHPEQVRIASRASRSGVYALIAVVGTGIACQICCVFEGVPAAEGLTETSRQVEVRIRSIALPCHYVQNRRITSVEPASVILRPGP